ncbi:MAG: hypothetical protein RMM17_10145 [Acidobacteriota bacterium]|nr:hypothetical protein [Blastocatellia bacterium]MDW8413030.1 hypothetical protein [Acidobacteriota bacterium]
MRICKICNRWVIGNRDHFCSGCGAQLRVCVLSKLDEVGDGCYKFEIRNAGQLPLSWLIEVDESLLVSPDYGELEADFSQLITVNTRMSTWSLKLYTNDPMKPELEVR